MRLGDFQDFTGQRRGSFLIKEQAPFVRGKSRKWVCVCNCGNIKIETSGNIKRAAYLRCNERCTAPQKSKMRFYMTWRGMILRCTDKNNRDYKHWGGRGITVCEEWASDYFCFHKWAEERYKKGLSLDRIDNNKGYFPENCRYTTPRIQCNNRRSNRLVKLNGKTKTLSDWLRTYNIPKITFFARVKKGWSIKSAITTPCIKK